MTDATIAIAAQPLVAELQPWVTAIVTALVGAAVTYGATIVHKLTGAALDNSSEASIRKWAASEAGALVASAADNLAGKSIPVGSSLVASAVLRLEAVLPDDIARLGFTPARLATIVAGEIGKLQAQAPPLPPPAKEPTP